jgi:segregation and condensation protein B
MQGDTMEEATADPVRVKMVLEAALLTSQEPMSVTELRKLFEPDVGAEALRQALEGIRGDWVGRGVELVQVASGWRFCAKSDMQAYLDRLSPQKPPKYSRAVLETLAIIAYRQPVTRGDIEEVRGVTVSTNIVKALEARGWIEVIGHREVAGRPALYATTRQFLDDLNLQSIDELPPLEDLGSLVEQNQGQSVTGEDLAGRQAGLFGPDEDAPEGSKRPAPERLAEQDLPEGRSESENDLTPDSGAAIPETEVGA